MGRPCTVCAHPERDSIDSALVDQVPYREISKRYGDVSVPALSRHFNGHVSPALTQVKSQRETEGAETLLQRIEDLYTRASSILDAAETDGKAGLMLSAIRELRSIVELLGKATGELRDGPTTVINVLQTGEWQQARAAIFEVLQAHPTTRIEVAHRLLALEGERSA